MVAFMPLKMASEWHFGNQRGREARPEALRNMGIDAFLETESGDALGEVFDERNRLSRAVQAGGHDSTVCLRFIDPWGDATFNWMQIPILIMELRALRERVDDETREQLDAIVLLADRHVERPHLYLKFYGD
jgi:hypothetical protein